MNEKQVEMVARYIDDHPRAVAARILSDKTTMPRLRAWLIEESGASMRRRMAMRLKEMRDAGYITEDTPVKDLLR